MPLILEKRPKASDAIKEEDEESRWKCLAGRDGGKNHEQENKGEEERTETKKTRRRCSGCIRGKSDEFTPEVCEAGGRSSSEGTNVKDDK